MMINTRPGLLRISGRPAFALIFTAVALSAGFLFQPARANGGLDLAAYEGKVVLLDFWASWCKPCRRSFPWMNDMHAKYGDDGLVIVAVNVDNDLADAKRFLADYPTKFQVRFDEKRLLVREYEVEAMPSAFLIGRDGEVVEQHLGFKVLKQDEYEAAIQSALQKDQ